MLPPIIRQYWKPFVCMFFSILLLLNALPYWFSPPKQIKFEAPISKQLHSLKKNTQPLENYPLFGESNESSSETINDTSLDLTLVGILNASDKNDSQALIKIDGNAEKLYSINDKLNENTVLWRILNKAVLLKRNGKIEKLSLPKSNLNIAKPPREAIQYEEDFE